ncbi:MAG: N-methyl-L-tryptophan oxidase [Phycisphaerales bacterium]
MNHRCHDVIVVGLGAAGSAAAMHLARRGLRVLGLDRFDIPTSMGSSHGITRLIRLCYFEHPDYVPLLRRAYELWREIEVESSRRLLFETGGVYVGRPDGELVAGSLAAAQAHALAHEVLDRAELASRWPQFRVPEDHVALFEPAMGYLLCEPAIMAHAELALRCGADLRGQEPVLRWSMDGAGVRVETPRGTHLASRLLITAGAWTAELAPRLGWPLRVTRQVVAWVWPKRPELFTEASGAPSLGGNEQAGSMPGSAPGLSPASPRRAPRPHAFPCWAVQHPGGGLHYGFPMARHGETGLGLKLGLHQPADETHADRVDRSLRGDDEATVRDFLRSTLPDADGPLLAMKVCLYTNTPDGHFAIDRHPEHAPVIVASPCSGHGFKFAPVIGEVLADLLERNSTRHEIGFLRATRWSQKPSSLDAPS